MFQSRKLNNRINCIQERALALPDLLNMDNSLAIHKRVLHKLHMKSFKIKIGTQPGITRNDFHIASTNYFSVWYYQDKIKTWNEIIWFTGALSSLIQFLATESTLKMMKNAFYFTLKALFILKIFKFFLDFLVIFKNNLIRKKRLISKFMTSKTI